MAKKLSLQAPVALSLKDKVQLSATGIIAFFCDAIGVGSFAINIALGKFFKQFRDDELPALANGAQVLPGALEAIFFLQIVFVDVKTLITLVVATCLGGIVGAHIMSKLKLQALRLTMLAAFIAIIALLFATEMQWLHIGGSAMKLTHHQLIWGFIGLFFCGALTSAGIGLFAMVQAVLFVLGMSPIVAFPIMTTAGALQQPLTTMIFVSHNKVPLKKTLIISLAGLIGLFIAIPLMVQLSTRALHFLLILVLSYNTLNIGYSFYRTQKQNANALNDDITVTV